MRGTRSAPPRCPPTPLLPRPHRRSRAISGWMRRAPRRYRPGVAPTFDPALQAELVAMAEEQFDIQKPLANLFELNPQFAEWAESAAPTLLTAKWEQGEPPPELARIYDAADRHDGRLVQIVDQHGWPGRGLVGEEGADAAWVVAQHADRHHLQRRSWLPLVERASLSGEADPRHFARLSDRIALVDGLRQLFGTYAVLHEDGTVSFDPPPEGSRADLDARRAVIGLPPVAEDLREPASAAPYRWMRTTPAYQWPARQTG
jgi:hypothetical protein